MQDEISSFTKHYRRDSFDSLAFKRADSIGKLVMLLPNSRANRALIKDYIISTKGEKRYCDRLYEYSVLVEDSAGIADAYLFTGLHYFNNLMFDSTYYYYNKSEKLYLNLKDSLNLSYIHYLKSIVLVKNGVYVDAEYQILKSMRYNNAKTPVKTRYQQYFGVADVFSGLAMYDDALHFYNQAFELLSSKEMILSQKVSYINLNKSYVIARMALVMVKKQQYEKAEELVLEAIDKYIDLSNDISERYYAYLAITLGDIKLKRKTYKSVKPILEEAIRIGGKNKNRIIIHRSKLVLAEYYYAIGQRDIASELLTKVQKEIKEKGDFESQLKALEILISYDSEYADKYFSEYLALSKSYKNEERINQRNFIRIKEEANNLSELNKVLTDRNKLLRGVFISLFILVSSGLFIYIYRLKVRKVRMTKMFQRDTEHYYNSIINVQNYLSTAKDTERTEIASELNDGVLNRLFAARFTLMQLQKGRIDLQKDLLINEISEVEKYIRNVSHDLVNEDSMKIHGFYQLLEELVLVKQKQSSINFRIKIDSRLELEELTHRKRINIYRSIEEALVNVSSHSDATHCLVDVKYKTPAVFEISITDNGKGFDSRFIKKGYGLIGIKERMGIIEAKVFILSKKGKGTKMLFVIPL